MSLETFMDLLKKNLSETDFTRMMTFIGAIEPERRASMENSTDLKYYALPDRLYLIGRDGRVAYRGGPGPFGFVAAELERAIEEYLGAGATKSAQS
jgi:hypothetical protein